MVKSIVRIFACILLVCFVFTLIACDNTSLSTNTESTADPSAETPAAFNELNWKVKSIPGKIMDVETYRSQMQIMAYESTSAAVETIFEQLEETYGHHAYAIEDRTYPRAFFNEHSLFIIQYSGSNMKVIDVTTDGRVLKIYCEKPSISKGETSVGTSWNRCYFLEVYGFKPVSAEDVILEISYPKL